ncbi:alpha/beta-Hydrolases superfamily protein [Artemisia annua]|uniref:Alpha/beta-Hydrolases superfamily protein n=1 Tax=Artemisia annua TaxID=35608 RepID=A0A2U1LYD4_ARTAN|nr:alpha/beta-Hydrolases superfamily protein [Artemisia annua]
MEAVSLTLTKSLIKPTNLHLLHKYQPSLTTINKYNQLTTLTLSNPNPKPHFLKPFITPRAFQPNHTYPIPHNPFAQFARISSDQTEKSFIWKFVNNADGAKFGYGDGDKGCAVTVVVLGWLGSKQKHLRRYAEMYNVVGANAVTFAVSVDNVIGFDFGRKLERRVEELCQEVVEWVEKKEEDGRERVVMFHTFSNTGWLAYGSILNILQGRNELLEKIIGCVVDSGGVPELDPKIWAAGFATAILKKQNSAVNASSEAGEVQNGAKNINTDEKEPMFMEVLLLTLFEKFFTYFLQLPDVKTRLINVTTTLSENQPDCPQLYLYSTADKVIPFQKIESFANHQKKLGRKVTTFDFKSSPHVDHYRTFPDTYRSLIESFLKDCLAAKGKQLQNLVQ